MKSIPVIVPPKRAQPRAAKACRQELTRGSTVGAASESGPQTDSQRIFLHDVVNQLTIMNLACFELRASECELGSESQSKAIGAIENAVQNAAELIEKLSGVVKEEAAKKNRATGKRPPVQTVPTNNVYPISPYLTRR